MNWLIPIFLVGGAIMLMSPPTRTRKYIYTFTKIPVEITVLVTEDKNESDKLLVDLNASGAYEVSYYVRTMRDLGEGSVPHNFSKVVTQSPVRQTSEVHLLPEQFCVQVTKKRRFWFDSTEIEVIIREDAKPITKEPKVIEHVQVQQIAAE